MNDGTIDKAQAFHLQGRLAEAEALYREVLQSRPDALRALEGLGVLAFQQGRAEEAAALFARGVRNRGQIRFASRPTSVNRFEILGRLDEALDHLRKAVALNGAFAQTWNSLGLLAYDQRRFADAESACREAIRLNPRFAAAYVNLGNALEALHRSVEAVQAMRTALRIEPDNHLGLTNLGQILVDFGDPDLLDEAEACAGSAEDPVAATSAAPENLGKVSAARPARRGFSVLQAVPGSGTLAARMPCHYIGQLLQEARTVR